MDAAHLYTPRIPSLRFARYLCGSARYGMRFTRVKCGSERCAIRGRAGARERGRGSGRGWEERQELSKMPEG